jgi:hypothetical protein
MSRRNDETLRRWAAELGLDDEFLLQCARLGVLPAEETEELDAAQRARLRRMERLCRALELDAFAGALVVELLEALEAARRDLDRRLDTSP